MLAFPEIHEPPAAAPAPQPAAVQQTQAIAASIVVVQGEVARFDQIAAGLKAIEDAHPKNVIVAAIDTPAGMKAAETAWRAYRNPRLEVERARKAAKAPVLALGKAIDTFAGGLEDRLREGEDHYKAQIEAEEARRAAIKAEQERIEREAAEAHAARLTTIRGYVTRCQEPGMTAARIQTGIDRLTAVDLSDPVPARAVELADAQCRALDAMRTLHGQAVAREAEAARQEAIRIENERQAEANRREAARIAAEAEAIRRQAAELAAREAASVQRGEMAVSQSAGQHSQESAGSTPAGRQDDSPLAAERRGGHAEDSEDLSGVAPGSPHHLLQDADRGLSEALASKPDAMLHAREAAAAIAGNPPFTPSAPTTPPAPADVPPLTLGTVCARLSGDVPDGIKVSEAFVRSLGITPMKGTGRAVLIAAADWPALKSALVKHLQGLV